jgi:hypothetical protein
VELNGRSNVGLVSMRNWFTKRSIIGKNEENEKGAALNFLGTGFVRFRSQGFA